MCLCLQEEVEDALENLCGVLPSSISSEVCWLDGTITLINSFIRRIRVNKILCLAD